MPWYALFNFGLFSVLSNQNSLMTALVLEVGVYNGSLLQPTIVPIVIKPRKKRDSFIRFVLVTLNFL